MIQPMSCRPAVGYDRNDFSRDDERPDPVFYERPRLVDHLDRRALQTVEQLVGTLLVEENPRVLDLMASHDSHLPQGLEAAEVVGLGLNEVELERNARLTRRVVQDLNTDPVLPFDDGAFDAVLNVVSVDYLVQPEAVLREAGRVLKPGGLLLVVFSNRYFPEKATGVWKASTEEERQLLLEDWIRATDLFDDPKSFASRGLPRPAEDRYAELGIPSDPVIAVYTDRAGGSGVERPDPAVVAGDVAAPDAALVAERKAAVRTTGCCPYCEQPLSKWAVPQTPFTEWNVETMYVCFNDACPYYVRGWRAMESQGNFGFSYRLRFNPDNDTFPPLPVPSHKAFRSGINGDASDLVNVATE